MTQPEAESAQDIVGEIRRRLTALVVATVALFIAIGAVGAYAYYVSDQNRQAVCSLRGDLEHRVERSEEIVAKHPEVIERFGFTPAQVAKEINNQQHTIAALSIVSCD